MVAARRPVAQPAGAREHAEGAGGAGRPGSDPVLACGLERVEHALGPVFDEWSRVLILGTMPSPASRAQGFYYGHPRNRFWPVMAALFEGPGARVPQMPEERRTFALAHGFALWDVLASCAIHGAADSSIADPVPNDLRRVLNVAPIREVFTTGSAAWSLYRRLCERACGKAAVKLPSTSPANAAWNLERLVEAYAPVRAAVFAPRSLLLR